MRADTQLDYAIFQLTPTRTRCELHIAAKGHTYKLASGLLKPFISHLKAAEEQLAKGGYSIRLEPPDPSRASWFTKGTMERFVRFVSTPEVLERVSSVEVELLELEETTRQQTADTNESSGPGQVDSTPSKTALSQLSPGGKPAGIAASDKGNKGFSDSVENGSEESSKQRLLRALDARRMMLQKEQGMAFARALAAGFNLDNMDDLVLFAECFGANRLREACVKFMALCKKRQEAGLALEDLELMAAENAQADMLYMGAMGGNAMGLVWPPPQGNGHELSHSPSASNEGKQAATEDSSEKDLEELTRRGSLDEQWQTGTPLRLGSGDGEGPPGVVKGHPMMATWQGQPHNQYMPGVPPYATMHPGMPNPYDPSFGFTGPARPGQMGLPYPHYLGSPYMPAPYPDGNGWQSHSPVPPQYWPGNQVGDPMDGSYHRSLHQQSISTPSSREKELHESMYDGDDMQDNGEDHLNGLSPDSSRRSARRSSSPRRRSASPMRKVQIGRTGGSKRSGMVVIRNINYIAPKAKQQDDDDSENSGSWSEDDESDEDETLKSSAETLRVSIEDAVGVVEANNRTSKHGKKRHPKKEKKKMASKDSMHQRDTNSSALSGGDDDVELDDTEHKQHASEQKDYVWVIGKRDKGAEEMTNLLPEDGHFSGNGVRTQGSFDPAVESVCVEKKGGVDTRDCQLAEVALLSQSTGSTRAFQSQSYDMFEQEQHQEGKKMPIVDDSYIIAGGGNAPITRSSAIMEPDFDFNSKVSDNTQVDKTLQDDSLLVLDRSAAREGTNMDWRMPLNLESEMPFDQFQDVGAAAYEPESFEPDDVFMVPDRGQDSYKRAWNSPLDYDMQVLAADLIDNGHHGEEEIAQEGDEPDLQEQEVEEKPTEPGPRKLSEKDAKAKAMKEMLERRKAAGGGRPGRPNPLAEAQLRAEKLRLYKAGLQKSKKEKEEEERKRIEDLKIQRQQRIAARSNPGGGSPSSPTVVRGARTPPPPLSKSSPKVLNKGSPLSPSVNRERLANGSRVPRNALDNPKSTESPVTRSVSSLTELHREAKKPTSVVRASTGSQLSPSSVKSAEPNPLNKLNGRVDDKIGRTKSGRADDKVSRTDSGLAEERVGRSESGRIEEMLGRTESGRTEGKEGHSESGRMSERPPAAATRNPKRVAPLDGPALHVKSPKSPSTDSKAVKKTPTVPSKPAVQKKAALAPKATTIEEAKVEPKSLLLSQEEPKVEKSESPMKVTEGENPRPVVAQNSSCDENENGNGHMEGVSHAPVVVDKARHENGFSIPIATSELLEASKEEPSHVGSSFRALSVDGLDDRQLEVEVSSSVGEDHAPVAHGSPPEDNHPALEEADIHTSEGHLIGDYSPPFAPPSEYALSPTTNPALISPTSQQEFATESSPNDSSSTRSRKKWGDSKAKGLKRLLLLGRKSGRSSTQNAVDIPSEGEEEESSSSNGKNLNIKSKNDLDNFSDQALGSLPAQADLGSSNSSSKGSRSIFSLSTFRGKSTVKA